MIPSRQNRWNRLGRALERIDRRWIFAIMALAVACPLFARFSVAARPGPATRAFDAAVERALADPRPVLLDVDFGPQTMAEMEPLLFLVLDRLFAAGKPVVVLTFMTESVALLRRYLSRYAHTYHLRYGRDYAFLGYASAYAYTMAGLGRSFADYFHEDVDGRPLETLPLMGAVRSLHDVSLVINIASNAFPRFWIQYAVTPYDIPFAAGVTAVSAAEYFPYLQTGQLDGLLAGGSGAGEYETLLVHKGAVAARGRASADLGAVSWALGAIVVFVLLGNLGYALQRRGERP